MKRIYLGWLLALALLLGWPGAALSQADLQLQVSSYEIAVGETLEVQLDAMSDSDDAPTHPELAVPNGFELQGPSVGTRQQVSISGFHMQRPQRRSRRGGRTPFDPFDPFGNDDAFNDLFDRLRGGANPGFERLPEAA